MIKILKFIINFYKILWFWFLGLPRVGKVLVGSFLIFAFAISSLANSSNKNVKKAEVLGINSSQQSSSSSSSSTINSYSSSVNSSVNNVLNNSQKSTEISQESSQEVVISVSNPVLAVLESENNSQNLPKSQETQKTDKKLYQVLEVVDGDTIKISEIGTLRLIGIDTPETKDPRKVVQCFGVEASNNAKNLLSGQKVYLEFDETHSKLDKYQRTLAYVFREDGYFYNLEAVKNGFAHSYKQYPHPKLDEFNLAENNARSGKIGFWADNTCQGNTEQGASGEVPKIAVPPTGGTQTTQEVPKSEIQTTGGIIKKSTNNICHDTNSKSYTKTKNFTSYNTIEECLASGGRLPLN